MTLISAIIFSNINLSTFKTLNFKKFDSPKFKITIDFAVWLLINSQENVANIVINIRKSDVAKLVLLNI